MSRYIHAFALICVAVASGFLIWLSMHLVDILAARDWCVRAIGADQASGDGKGIDVMTACVGLLTLQVNALAIDSHVAIGTLALCLAVLVVVVLANARIQGKAGAGGVEGSIGGAGKADEVKE